MFVLNVKEVVLPLMEKYVTGAVFPYRKRLQKRPTVKLFHCQPFGKPN